MHLQESGEMYLETIYVLSKERSGVRAIDVGEQLGFSKPSVSRAMGLLKSAGYVLSDKDGFLSLSTSGLQVAQKIYERHILLKQFLMEIGVEEAVATSDACRMEHVISDASFEAIKRHAAQGAVSQT